MQSNTTHTKKILQALRQTALMLIVIASAISFSDVAHAQFFDSQKRQVINTAYEGKPQQQVSSGIINLLDNVSTSQGSAGELKEVLETLSSYTIAENYKTAKRGVNFGDSKIEDKAQKAASLINKMQAAGAITGEEAARLRNETKSLSTTALQRARTAAEALGETTTAKELIEDSNDIVTGELQSCPTSSQLKARYHSGCWSCFVIEKLTSAFLYAAKAGMPITQKAGVLLLVLGAGIWLVFWALKNVSSFTEIQAGNILNDLFKFMFKMGVAYWFIVYSGTAISQYFIRPIMSVGAIIGQQFWADEVVEYTAPWDDVEPVEDLQAIVKSDEAKAVKEEPKTTQTPVPSQEEQQLLKEARSLEIKENQKSSIPMFQVPGVPGVITSYPGCRVPPKTATGYGSASHMGLDIAQNNMAPISANASGRISYGGNASTGWGLYATITTIHNGNTWTHLYGHMNPQTYNQFKSKLNGKEVVIGQQIGNVGTTGNSSGPHLHLEIQLTGKVGEYTYKQTYLDPISLGQGKIVPRAFDYNESTKTFTFNKKKCNGSAEPIPDTGYSKGSRLPEGGLCSLGTAALDLSSTYVYDGDLSYSGGFEDVVTIADVRYTGPTDILPKSVMNSILGAMRAITDTTADNMVLGNMIMCYSTLKDGGAWNIKAFRLELLHYPNIFMWLEGAIIWCLGFLLTLAIAYYFIDISFKIGFAVLALPIVMGLWPFGFARDKLFICISIIAKSAALFAFLAISTSFGMGLVSAALGDMSALFDKIDLIIANGDQIPEYDALRNEISDTLYLFSPLFLMLMFAIIYFYKLVQGTSSDLVNKFFPDKVFGDSSPMHRAATMMTDFSKKMAMKISGANLAKDFVGHQVGRAAQKVGQRAFKGIGAAAKATGRTATNTFNKIRGKN